MLHLMAWWVRKSPVQEGKLQSHGHLMAHAQAFSLYQAPVVVQELFLKWRVVIQKRRQGFTLKLYLSLLQFTYAATAAKSLQSCPTLCNTIDGSPPGCSVLGILQVRTLEWVSISFSSAWKWKMKVKSLSHVLLLATPWTAAYQAPPSMGFPGKSTGVGCHCLLQKLLLVMS